MTEQATTAESAARSAERIGHLLHPRAAAEQMRAIIGADPAGADPGALFVVARELLAERDLLAAEIETMREHERLRTASAAQRLAERARAVGGALDRVAALAGGQPVASTGPWRWDESVVWNAPDTVTVPISRDGVDGELAMDAAQAAILAEMLADAAKGGGS